MPFSELLAIRGVPWLVDTSLQSLLCRHLAVFPLCVCLCISSLKDSSHIGLRAHILQYDLILPNHIYNNLFFQIRSHAHEACELGGLVDTIQ